jgi:hypothetical protein
MNKFDNLHFLTYDLIVFKTMFKLISLFLITYISIYNSQKFVSIP